MGNVGKTIGRVVGAVASFGLSEVAIAVAEALTPKQQQQMQSAKDQIAAIQAEKDQAQKEHEELKARLRTEGKQLQEGDVKTYHQNMKKFFKNQIAAVKKLPQPPKTEKFSLACMGKTCAGKTSLLNRLFNLHLTTSARRNTSGFNKVYEERGLEVWDIFGDNDDESYHAVETLTAAKTLHMLVIVYTDAVNHVQNMAELALALNVPLIFFRNKCEHLTTAAERKEVCDGDSEDLQKVTKAPVTLFVGSAKYGISVDSLKKLLEEGVESAPSRNIQEGPQNKKRRT